jgi:tRNA nucleotidyltransferase/poly(A) polymerase
MATPAGISLRDQATGIVRRLHAAGHRAFWVGGCVRDYLLGREPGDYDIATSALPEQIERLFRRTFAVGRKFGVMIVVEGDHQFQVATFRAEADYRDGRHPEQVTFGDAAADARRRDFTVNGLFYDPVAEALHDWVEGGPDLRARIIRTIGSPDERFAEDHLRLLRGVRLAAQLDFQIEPKTFAAIRTHAAKIQAISAERIRDELIKLFHPPRDGNAGRQPGVIRAEPGDGTATGAPPPAGETPNGRRAARGLELLRESGLLEHILPELAATIGCRQSPDYHPEGDVFTHLCLMLRHLPADAHPSLPWAVLLHDVAKPVTASRDPRTGAIHFYQHEKIGAQMAEQILERLRFPRKQIDDIAAAVRYHMQFKDAPQMRKATLRRMLLRDTFPLELQLHRLDCLGSHGQLEVYDYLAAQAQELAGQPQIRPPLLTGEDLMALGMKPGPAMGALLKEIREKQLQDELQTPAAARDWAKARITTG